MEKDNRQISKMLSLVLRHEPERLGISLDENGWTSVSTLITKLNSTGISIAMSELEAIVATNDKQRFAFNEDRSLIRANQGHSVEVDLQLKEGVPPEILYHGTSVKYVAAILKEGLKRQQRHHVHLSTSVEQATAVGSRRGKPFIFKVKAGEMYKAGYRFYVSPNLVWLTDAVPAQYVLQ